jgi:hypothetical protein
MSNLPVAAFLATELVRRQFQDGRPVTPTEPAAPGWSPVRGVRVALATRLARAADAVAPAGYHLAH